ncbi:MAG: signal peptidase II [Thermodesulfobacteriota bacterium]
MGKWTLAALTAAGTVVLDHASKAAVWYYLAPHGQVKVIPGFFDLTFVLNTGVAFGLLSGRSPGFRILGLVTFALCALAVIVYFLHTAKKDERFFVLALALIAGGAVGNAIDRLRLGAVIDFLDFHAGAYHWPAFNVADAGITVGTALIILHLWRAR